MLMILIIANDFAAEYLLHLIIVSEKVQRHM